MPVEYATAAEDFSLSVPGDPDHTVVLNLPHVVDDQKDLSAVLAFRVYPTKGTALKFYVVVPGAPTFTASIDYVGTFFRTVHWIVPNSSFKKGPNNLVFKLFDGTGRVQFNDIVLWYRAKS